MKVAAKLAPSSGRCGTPATTSGIVVPATSSSVAATSIAWTYWCRTSPRAENPAGQCAMSGSATPPSCTSRFHRRNGVLPATVQPHG
jgi:hypothetical protein